MALRRVLSNLIQNAQRYAAGFPVTLVCEQGLKVCASVCWIRGLAFRKQNSKGCSNLFNGWRRHVVRVQAVLG